MIADQIGLSLLMSNRFAQPRCTDRALDTADVRETDNSAIGTLRIDFIQPSANLIIKDSGVFWPAESEEGYDLLGPGYPPVSSDHGLVWVDVVVQYSIQEKHWCTE